MKRTCETLKEQYGKGKTNQAVNAAIRAEIPGGPQVLDALDLLHTITKDGDKIVSPALTLLREAKTDMVDCVMRRGRWEDQT